MAPTIPGSKKLVLAGTATANFIDDYHTWIDANPGGFTVENVVGTAPNVTSFTLLHTADLWQLNYRLSGGEILSMVAPNGGISDSATPGTPTGASPETALLPVFSGTAAEALISRYDDAIFIGIKNSAKTLLSYAAYHGKILYVGDTPNESPTGFGVLAYLIDMTSSFTAYKWFTTNSTASNRKSWIQITSTDWAAPTVVRSGENVTSTGDGTRFSKETVAAGSNADAPSATGDPARGSLRHIRIDTAGTAAIFAVDPSGASDQGMIALRDSTSLTRGRVMWNKTVTP